MGRGDVWLRYRRCCSEGCGAGGKAGPCELEYIDYLNMDNTTD